MAVPGGDVPEHATPPGDVDELAHQLVRLARLFERSRADFAARHGNGVERAGYVLLARLVTDGPARLCALAEAVYSDPSTVSRQVARLVRLGLVERCPDPRDGRAAQLSATDAGRQAFAEHRRIRRQHLAAALSGWSAPEVHRLSELLDRLNTDLENHRTARLAETSWRGVRTEPDPAL